MAKGLIVERAPNLVSTLNCGGRISIVPTRRNVLAAIPAVFMATKAFASTTEEVPGIDERVNELVKALEALHGGHWTPTIDPQKEFVMICKG
jgi:hypothetical protein